MTELQFSSEVPMKKLFSLLFIYSVGMSFLSNTSQAQWVQANGPYGGFVRCFLVNGANLFAGTYGGGVFLSTNNGTSWTAVNSGLTNTNIRCLAVSASNLFAGTDDGVFLPPTTVPLGQQ